MATIVFDFDDRYKITPPKNSKICSDLINLKMIKCLIMFRRSIVNITEKAVSTSITWPFKICLYANNASAVLQWIYMRAEKQDVSLGQN